MFINNIDWSDAELPFGGIKNSGYGRELGDMGIQEFVNKKLVRTLDGQRAGVSASNPVNVAAQRRGALRIRARMHRSPEAASPDPQRASHMYVNVAVLKETRPHERRVALVPSVAPKLVKLGAKLHMQSGAGDAISLADSALQATSPSWMTAKPSWRTPMSCSPSSHRRWTWSTR